MFNTIHTYRSFAMGSDYSLGRLKMKTRDEKPKAHISKYELREFLSYHKRSISYAEFADMKKKMLGIDFSNIIDHLEELQEKLGADRFNVSKDFGYRFVHIWFKRTRMNGLRVVGDSKYKYTFSFDSKGKLFQIDYDIK